MDNLWIFLIFLCANPHLHLVSDREDLSNTFRKVPKAARIEPPIHVVYFRSGGAKILILVPLTANFSISFFTR